MWQEKSSKKVSFLWKAVPLKQTVTERLAEVNIPPALICVCFHLLSNPAVKLRSSPELSKEPAGLERKKKLLYKTFIWLTDSSLLHLHKDAQGRNHRDKDPKYPENAYESNKLISKKGNFRSTRCPIWTNVVLQKSFSITSSVYSYFPVKLLCGNFLVKRFSHDASHQVLKWGALNSQQMVTFLGHSFSVASTTLKKKKILLFVLYILTTNS